MKGCILLLFVFLLNLYSTYANSSKVIFTGLQTLYHRELIQIHSESGNLKYKLMENSIELYQIPEAITLILIGLADAEKNNKGWLNNGQISEREMASWRTNFKPNDFNLVSTQSYNFSSFTDIIAIFPDGSEYSLIRHALQF